jgi:6-pyruvoyltetrahydropterin/6-carboxytetrahydropterin synthase
MTRSFELSQKFYFEAAHSLEREVDAEASRRIHGHTYHVEVSIAGDPDPETGMLVDLGVFRREIARVRDLLDHRFLDDVEDIGPATLENLCTYIFDQLGDAFGRVTQVAIERPASGDKCVLRSTADQSAEAFLVGTVAAGVTGSCRSDPKVCA